MYFISPPFQVLGLCITRVEVSSCSAFVWLFRTRLHPLDTMEVLCWVSKYYKNLFGDECYINVRPFQKSFLGILSSSEDLEIFY